MSEQFTAADVTRLHDELTRLRADLLTARRERDETKADAKRAVSELFDAREQCDEARRTVERLRAALISVEHLYGPQFSSVTASLVRHALAATPNAFVDAAKAVVESGVLDCVMDTPSTVPVVPLADAEALATALQGVVYGYSSALISYDAERLKNVLAAYRSRHPAPKDPLP